MAGGQNIQSLGAGGLYGNINDGGNSGVNISVRDRLDYARLGSPNRTPEAEFPDGYLGTQNCRRGDKLLEKIDRINKRSYQRGVHRGERIDTGDYAWPASWRPDRGLVHQSMGLRQTLAAQGPEPRLVRGGADLPPPPVSGPVGGGQPHVNEQMSWMLPPWR